MSRWLALADGAAHRAVPSLFESRGIPMRAFF